MDLNGKADSLPAELQGKPTQPTKFTKSALEWIEKVLPGNQVSIWGFTYNQGAWIGQPPMKEETALQEIKKKKKKTQFFL